MAFYVIERATRRPDHNPVVGVRQQIRRLDSDAIAGRDPKIGSTSGGDPARQPGAIRGRDPKIGS